MHPIAKGYELKKLLDDQEYNEQTGRFSSDAPLRNIQTLADMGLLGPLLNLKSLEDEKIVNEFSPLYA
jgi:hypothetical protein